MCVENVLMNITVGIHLILSHFKLTAVSLFHIDLILVPLSQIMIMKIPCSTDRKADSEIVLRLKCDIVK